MLVQLGEGADWSLRLLLLLDDPGYVLMWGSAWSEVALTHNLLNFLPQAVVPLLLCVGRDVVRRLLI